MKRPGGHGLAPFILLLIVLAGIVSTHCGGTGDHAVSRVILIGIDGLDWKVLDETVSRGEAPNIARFIERGARGKIGTLSPTYSPIVWASIATGKRPVKHGITGFGKRDGSADGKIVPYTSNSRRVKALWNILGEAGRRVAVVGWWTTWPAEHVNGVLVSDRMQYNRFNIWLGGAAFGDDLPAQTHPVELYETLAADAREERAVRREFADRFAGGGPLPAFEENLHDPWYELFLAFSRDDAYGRMLDRVLRDDTFEFTAFYLNGPDIASHYFWKYRFPEEWNEPIAPEEQAQNERVIDRYYGYVDEVIGPLLEQAGPDCVVILVSDHGFETGPRSDSPSISGTHYRSAPPGIVIMAGGSIPAGGELGATSILDVTPTILHVMGLPVGRDMDGRVIRTTGTSASGTARPVAFVDTYDTGSRTTDTEPLATEVDETIVEKLRALGYIGSEGAVD